jgi:RimJ/RimL family protein N-acetyltransferase
LTDASFLELLGLKILNATTTVTPKIQRPHRVQGKAIRFKDVRIEDAEFILALRLDETKNKYLSPVDHSLESQREWIRRYQESDNQAYFVICDNQNNPLGTVRIYDPLGESFSWGSWILRSGAPATAAIESSLMVYRLATEHWGFRAAHFQVDKQNAAVLRFHERFGAIRCGESGNSILFQIELSTIQHAIQRHAKFLSPTLGVDVGC